MFCSKCQLSSYMSMYTEYKYCVCISNYSTGVTSSSIVLLSLLLQVATFKMVL